MVSFEFVKNFLRLTHKFLVLSDYLQRICLIEWNWRLWLVESTHSTHVLVKTLVESLIPLIPSLVLSLILSLIVVTLIVEALIVVTLVIPALVVTGVPSTLISNIVPSLN